MPNINLSSTPTEQAIEGFGGALTDSAAYLIAHSPLKVGILESLFSSSGARLSMIRLPLGASDFVAKPNANCASGSAASCYAPSPKCDTAGLTEIEYKKLEEKEKIACFRTYEDEQGSFGIDHDKTNIIPVLHSAKGLNPAIKLLATPWSAPGWMKISGRYLVKNCSEDEGEANFLSPGAEASYARYLAQAAAAYEKEQLPFAIISLGNEPQNCQTSYPTMNMFPAQEANVSNELSADLKNPAYGLSTQPEILGWDHNWSECGGPSRARYPAELLANPINKVSDIGFHSYCNGLPYPDQFAKDVGVYVTESTGFGKNNVSAGANLRYELKHELIDPIRDGAKGSLYWNLALDSDCGPQFNGGPTKCPSSVKSYAGCTNCRPMVTINKEGKPSYNEDYYYWEQFSKFVARGAKRIELESTPKWPLDTVAFENPDKSIVVVVLNEEKSGMSGRV